jgi:type II secretory pathway predicted ATPase ExeA
MMPPTGKQVRKLRSHFAFSKMPFSKGMLASNMFDSSGQRDLLHGLHLWLEVRGFCLVTGPSGVGKSITLRRFVQDLDDAKFKVIEFAYLPTTVTGFLRSMSRSLGIPTRLHASDMFDAAQNLLFSYENDHGQHPVLVVDDAEGLRPPILDLLRRLAAFALDSDDRFSILFSATDDIIPRLSDPSLASLRSRFLYANALRPFGFEDTLNYIRFHLQRAGVDPDLFTEPAVKRLFQVSHGRPRNINQLAIQALIHAAVQGLDKLDGEFISHLIATHPLYQTQGAER